MVIKKMGCISILICMLTYALTSQEVLTLEQAMTSALKNSPRLNASNKQIEHDRLLEKSAWNLPDPELILESPTGEFMTLGVEQSMEFPTVYGRQKQVARQQTQLAEKSKLLMEVEVKQLVKQAYLDWQYAMANYQQQKSRDSLYQEVAKTAFRQHAAGEIDYVEKTYTDMQYTSSHAQWLSADAEVKRTLQQIQVYVGTKDSLVPTTFRKLDDERMMSLLASADPNADESPLLDYSIQKESYMSSNIRLEKSKALPDLKVGYLNPADKNTPIAMRMRFGMSVPLWFWQYKANTNAAKSQLEIAQLESETVRQDWMIEWNKTKGEALKNYNTLAYYETNGLTQANDLIQASGRMFSAGEYDYIRYLTTVSDAYRIREEYLSAVYAYNQSLIQLQYLIGQ